jgi:hypothetical protein
MPGALRVLVYSYWHRQVREAGSIVIAKPPRYGVVWIYLQQLVQASIGRIQCLLIKAIGINEVGQEAKL